MHRIVLLLVVSTPIALEWNITDSSAMETKQPIATSIMPPVFQNVMPVTSKTKRPLPRGKSDSPMLNYIFDSYATSNKHLHDKFKAPSFEADVTTDDTIMEADTGATVNFECRVTSLRDKMVSWLKVSDGENLELLTLDLDTHTTDSRFRVDLAGENWQLALSNAKDKDSGIYCCHVSTHPPMLRRVKLAVHSPEIKMTKETFLETSETLSLKCMIMHLHTGEIEPRLRWYRENRSVSLDEVRGGVLIETDHLTLTSHLQSKLQLQSNQYRENSMDFTTTVKLVVVTIFLTTRNGIMVVASLKLEDAGNYTCALEAPIILKTVARVHVLQGSSLAELQSGVKTTTSYMSLLLASTLVVLGIYGDVR